METGVNSAGQDVELQSVGPNGPIRDSLPANDIGRWADQDTLAKVRAPPPAYPPPSATAVRSARPAQGAVINNRRHIERLISRTTMETESETDGGDGGDWQTRESRKSAKRRRQESQQQQQDRPQELVPSAAPSRSGRRVHVIGAGSDDKLKSSGHVLNKRVFAVSNISNEFSTEDIVSFLRDCHQVNVINCFQVKSRFDNSKTFRVCITLSDEEKFLDSRIWPKNVILRNWHFKPKTGSDDVNPRNN